MAKEACCNTNPRMRPHLLPLLCCTALLAAGEAWLTDYDAAKAEAAASKRDLLIDFTGSDWCHWCKKLDGEILDKPAFLKAAPERFVLLKLDFLKKTRLPAERQAALDKLKTQYAIEGFPTLVLASADGTAYARTGYQKMDPAAYAQRLVAMGAARGREPELRAAVAAATGQARAEALAKLIEHLELMGGEVGRDLLASAVEADPGNALPGTAALRVRLLEMDAWTALDAAIKANDTKKTAELIAAGLADLRLSAPFRSNLMMQRGMTKWKDDTAGARADLIAARDLDPQGAGAEQLGMLIQALDGKLEREKAKPKP